MPEQRYSLDTNVLWHGMLPSQDPIAETCRRLMRAIDDEEIRAYCSTLSLVELPKVLSPEVPLERIVALTEQLRTSRIVWVPLTEAIAMKARDLSLERNLAPAYDAVVLATAIEVSARTLYTYDRDDFPVGQTIDGVRVSSPELPPELQQQSLDVDG